MKIFLFFLLFFMCVPNYLKEAKGKVVLSPYKNYFTIVNSINNEKVKKWHNYFVENPNRLKELSQSFYSIPQESNFEFKFFAYDSLNKKYLIRYFAFKPDPVDIAGWEVIFIFDEKGNLQRVYISEVPLEK